MRFIAAVFRALCFSVALLVELFLCLYQHKLGLYPLFSAFNLVDKFSIQIFYGWYQNGDAFYGTQFVECIFKWI